MPNPNDNEQQNDQVRRQAGRNEDDRMPGNGNPGGDQIKNLPGNGAKRGDQGTAGGGRHH